MCIEQFLRITVCFFDQNWSGVGAGSARCFSKSSPQLWGGHKQTIKQFQNGFPVQTGAPRDVRR